MQVPNPMPRPSRTAAPGAGTRAAPRRIAVVGLGLIGGSLLRRLAGLATHDHGTGHGPAGGYEVLGHDADPATRDAARAAGYTVADTPAAAVAGAGTVVVATPLAAFPAVLPEITAAARHDAVVTDVASVKVAAAEAVRRAGVVQRFVGGHPMAGTERSGFAASDPALLDGAAWVLCLEPGTDLTAWLDLAALYLDLGCRVVPCGPAEHDAAVARVSGLPHVLAAALAATAGRERLPYALAAGSFRDGTRVAGTRPELTTALCDGNREALADALDEVVDRLSEARDRLRSGRSVRPLVEDGYAAREAWRRHGEDGDRFALDRDDPALAAHLLALGALGGHVRALSAARVHCWRPA